MDALRALSPSLAITKPCTDHTGPIVELSYEPTPPDFTIRTIISCIVSADPAFTPSLYHSPTLEQRTRTMQRLEQTSLLRRLLFAFVVAIPTFVIAVVYMSLVPAGSSKRYLMEPMWFGNASRIQWSSFFLATPVMFYSSAHFHWRSIKEIIVSWRPGSSTPLIRRFTRFGSMNLLVSPSLALHSSTIPFRFPQACLWRILLPSLSWHSLHLSQPLQTESVIQPPTLIRSFSSPCFYFVVCLGTLNHFSRLIET